ncbi:MAG: UDP-N-acetylmuramate dehydrogenase [Candidatus Latescibacterota bacterium]|nr:MAG: UDP-N-acetylmuramate dehydrogenase [Candidatus Latescibacterota bacterium]
MAKHTTIGAGGRARYFAIPRSTGEVVGLVRAALELDIDYIGIGRGSNLIVRDGGFSGLVIKVADNMRNLRLFSRTAHAEAGVSFTRLGRTLTREGRPGFEFAVGIPGSVGGAVRMNAGAFGRDIARVLKKATVVDGEGRVVRFTPEELGFGYRQSALPSDAIVLSVIFNCPPGEIDKEALRLSRSRGETQPLAQKSFGSTFKNPPGGVAAKMIEECGLKGTRRGGAMVSDKHANFIVNVGTKTEANDIEDLIDFIINRVKARFGVELTPEVIIIGDR